MTTRPNHPFPRQDFHLQVCQRLRAAHRNLLLGRPRVLYATRVNQLPIMRKGIIMASIMVVGVAITLWWPGARSQGPLVLPQGTKSLSASDIIGARWGARTCLWKQVCREIKAGEFREGWRQFGMMLRPVPVVRGDSSSKGTHAQVFLTRHYSLGLNKEDGRWVVRSVLMQASWKGMASSVTNGGPALISNKQFLGY